MKKVTYDFKKVTPEMAARVDAVLAEAQRHTYSVSRVYGAYNEVMETNDRPESCPTCLRTRVKELQDWKRAYDEANATPAKETKAPKSKLEVVDDAKTPATKDADEKDYINTEAKNYVAPAEGVTRLFSKLEDDNDAMPLDFIPGQDLAAPHKGTVKYADGTNVKPGKYVMSDGSTVGVQPGGKATITAAEDLT